MGQIDAEDGVMPETTAEQEHGNGLKLVPVSESIRYRKRAQGAEKKAETLEEQLAQAKSEIAEMTDKLGSMEAEQELVRKLTAAGSIDLDAAVLIAKVRLKESGDADLESVVEQLKKDKQYLFAEKTSAGLVAQKTAGVKGSVVNNQTVLERAAKKAASSGNRVDLHEYLRLRRNFV